MEFSKVNLDEPVTNLLDFSKKWGGFGHKGDPQGRLEFLEQKVADIRATGREPTEYALRELSDLKSVIGPAGEPGK